MKRVHTAQAPGSQSLESFGKATYMLLRQYAFPDTYEHDEEFLSADSDRIFSWDHEHARACSQRHIGDQSFLTWLQCAESAAILAFCKDMLKAKDSVVWTGFRVLGSVNAATGYNVWTYQVFAKDPTKDTKVYSGGRAPNVESQEPSRMDFFDYDGQPSWIRRNR